MDGSQTGTSIPISPGGFSNIPEIMRRTRPWVLFISILNFVGAGFMGLVILVMLGSLMAGRAMALSFAFVLVYALFFVLNLFLGLYLFRYASWIARYAAEPKEDLLAEALDAQRIYWKLMGILAIVGICLGLVISVGMVILGIKTWT